MTEETTPKRAEGGFPAEQLPKIAQMRGLQTLAQGLAVAVVMAALTAFGAGLTADSWTEWIASWPIWTWAAFQAAGTAAVAYLVRRFADTSGAEEN